MKSVLKWALIVSGIVVAAWFSKKQTDGFTIAKISSDLSYYPDWETEEKLTDSQVRKILSQPFRYLGKGAQVFAFESEDGSYVLKFFRHDHMRPRPWLAALPLHGHKKRIEKLHETFSSYRIASDDLREETGLVFLHLNKTSRLHHKIRVVDKIGIEHLVDADKTEFVIQKKADLLYATLEKWMADGKKEEACQLIGSIVSYLKKRCHQAIFDKDPNLETNFGVLEGKPLQFDLGRFRKRHPYTEKEAQDEMVRVTDRLHVWLSEKSPELDAYLMEQVKS